ncbi:hypothetical protein F751_6118 [Auxenochlorella protothecoides]|uniref:HMG box domain-containing protein n=1 Tax=Auxenochlorella protothecoides TaxID=3075 RepID=A0A087SHF9_AUXPR|nr:hypothetical protein F751_6118 [Auxenochlorella protothecoides]KFM25163.1 hypothetical protein F751_6118 [Auxenochlorella protothecoides]
MFGRLYCAARYGSRGGPYVGCCQEPILAAGAEAASPSAAAGEGGAEAEEPAGPSTPPRPKSAFFYYLEAFKDQWRAEHPRATPQVKTLSQLASVSWRAMTGRDPETPTC